MKRILACILALVMSLSVFAGCSIKSTGGKNPSGESTTEESGELPSSESTGENQSGGPAGQGSTAGNKGDKNNGNNGNNSGNKGDKGDKDDLTNKNDDKIEKVPVKPAGVGFVKGVTDVKTTFNGKTIVFYVAETWGHNSNNRNVLYPQLQKDYGLKVVAKPSTFLRDTLQNVQEIKARKQIDLIGVGHEKLPSVFAICQPLQSKIDVSKAPAGIDKSLMNAMKKGNDIMFLPVAGSKEGIIYNAKNIKRAGKELPYDLYKKGQWTWDKFEEYCKYFTEDNDKNGVPERWGFGCWTRTLHEFPLTNNAGYYTYNSNGSVTSNITTDPVISAINYVKNIYGKEKCFYFFKGLGNYPEFFTDETVTMLKMGYVHNPKDLEFGMAPMPKGQNAGSENIVTSLGIGYGLPSTMVKKSNEKAALLLASTMLDYQSKDEKREFEVRFSGKNKRWEQEYKDVFLETPTKMLILYGVGEINKKLDKIEEAMTDPSKSVENVVQSLKTVFENEAKKVYTLSN